jgi:hypothetical protein
MERRFKLLGIAVMLFAVIASFGFSQAGSVAGPVNMRIEVTNRGPLHAGDGTRFLVWVVNNYRLQLPPTPIRLVARDQFPNAYVVTGIDIVMTVNGVMAYEMNWHPPPYPDWPPSSGYWPMTVTCPDTGPPCNIVGSPAVLPGESLYIFYLGWIHGADEPNGMYVVTFTLHGTVNGNSLVLTAKTSPIWMIQ